MILLASILGRDLNTANDDITRVEPYVDGLHLDIADGKFVPNVNMPDLAKIQTELPIDVHLMVENPSAHIAQCKIKNLKLKIAAIAFHIETAEDVFENVRAIHEGGMEAWLVINPETPAETLFPYLDQIEGVVVMTIVPGFSGQPFLEEPLGKIQKLKTKNQKLKILVDGGVNDRTIGKIRDAGADMVVSGSYLFGGGDVAERAKTLKNS